MQRLLLKVTLCIIAALGVLLAPQRCSFGQDPAKEDTKTLPTLTAILTQQAADWNEGNIEAFMKAYWNSENLTFSSGGKTERGWKATRDRYRKGYPDRETMGKLTFSSLEVFPLGDSAALMLGRWKLDRKEPAGGNFSLVWRKIDGAWLIVHDHTSSDAVPAKKE